MKMAESSESSVRKNSCQLHTSMNLVVLRHTVVLIISLPVMIPKTGFQIRHGKSKHDQSIHYNK